MIFLIKPIYETNKKTEMKILKFYFQKNKKIKTEYKKQLQNRLSGSGRGRLRRRRLRDRARTCQGERVRCESPRGT